jgi:chemotaxis protein CheD
MINNQIKVRMAEYKIGRDTDILITVGLGSCVGVTLYDRFNKIGGLIHIMLSENKKGLNPAKYADTGIPLLLSKMEELGAKRSTIVAKIAGGAHMFSIAEENSSMRIGTRNINAVCEILKKEKIELVAMDVGENYGRTMEFYLEDGEVLVRSYKKGEKII